MTYWLISLLVSVTLTCAVNITELPATCALEKADFADLENEITDRLLTTEINT